MLEIKILKNTELHVLDLFPDTKLSFTFNSTIWDFDKISGSYSLPFDIPLTAKNNSILDHPKLGTVQDKPIEYKYRTEIWVNGLIFKSGILLIEMSKETKAQAVILVNVSAIYEYKDTLLSEIDFEDLTFIWKNEYLPNTDKFALPEINNPSYSENSFFNGRNENINSFNTNLNNYNSRYVYNVLEGASEYYPIVPQPQLYYIIEKIFEFFNISIKEKTYFTNFKNIVIVNINDAYNIQYDASTDKFIHKAFQINFKKHVPDITIGQFLLAISNFFGANFNIINDVVSLDFIKDYITSDEFIDITEKSSKYFEINYINKISGIKLVWQSPKDKNNENFMLHQQIESDYELSDVLPPDHGDFTIQDTPPNSGYVMVPPDGITYIPYFYVSRYFDLNGNGTYIYIWHPLYSIPDTNLNQFFCYIGQDYFQTILKENTLEINLNIEGYFTPTYSWSTNYDFSIINQRGNSDLFFDKKEKLNLRLAFYNGKNSNGKPFMSHWSNNLQLDLWSHNGIYNTFWKTIFEYLKTVDYNIQRKFIFSQRDLMFFDFSKKFKIDNQLFFFKSINFSIDINGNFSQTSATLMPV